ncbi:MAG TPA: hypothetical protein VKU02_02805, partial [Gemmataceae bacterium]|nr:hypothetical protein [Gemmataceae bacterium]
MTRFFGGILVLAVFIAHPGHGCADYIFTTIDVPGSVQTVASGINDAGQVVGYYNEAGGGRGSQHGFLLSNGLYTTLDVPGAVVTQAMGLNNVGQIVGSYGDAAGTHGFILSGGSYTQLDVKAIASYFPENAVKIFNRASSSQPAIRRLPRRLALQEVSCCKTDTTRR